MGLTDKKWFTELGLNEGDFASCPEGSNELLWALDNNLINDEKYMAWASGEYLLPTVKSEFFNLSVDQYLCEKYQDIYNWSEEFFPIYEWENILYISCLEPVEWKSSKDICQIIAPRAAMKLLWNKIKPTKVKAPEEKVDLHLDFSTIAGAEAPPESSERAAPKKQIPPPTPASEGETLQGLSFEALAGDAPPPPIDDDATPPPQVPPAPEAPSFSSEPITPPPPTEVVTDPVAEIPPVPMAEQAAPPPGLEMEAEKQSPEIPKTHYNPAENKTVIPVPAEPHESIPQEFLVNTSDFSAVKDLAQCKDTKQVVLHIFSHIHKDFEKLMWIQKVKDKTYHPKLVYGQWVMEKESWKTPVNIDKPNIFRIAWNSRLPFHGNVSNNATNQSYFDLWNDGNVPEHITIFPLIAGVNNCEGFIVGCELGTEFDSKHTFKKLETLIDLSHKKLSPEKDKAS